MAVARSNFERVFGLDLSCGSTPTPALNCHPTQLIDSVDRAALVETMMMKHWIHPSQICAATACALLIAGCSDVSTDMRVTSAAAPSVGLARAASGLAATEPDDGSAATDATEVALAKAPERNVRVRGIVRFDGQPPEPNVIDVSRDKHCKKLHADQPLHDQDMLINDDSEVQNVFVYVKHRFQQKFPVPEEPAVIDQKDCMYSPRVQGIRAGQTLQIVNSDDTTHNVRSFPTRNRAFNLGQIGVGTRDKVFKRSEREVVEFRCDIHRWMLAWVWVLDHPFFGVTGDDGTYDIADLPAGEYTLIAWHEELGEVKQKIQVEDDGVLEVNFTFEEK